MTLAVAEALNPNKPNLNNWHVSHGRYSSMACLCAKYLYPFQRSNWPDVLSMVDAVARKAVLGFSILDTALWENMDSQVSRKLLFFCHTDGSVPMSSIKYKQM